MEIPHCFKSTSLFDPATSLCRTCPLFLACSAHLGGEPTRAIKKRHFLRELIIQEAPPGIIDNAYVALFHVNFNAARCARKYHARKQRASLK